MEEAARERARTRSAWANAKALFVAHNDEDYAHVHIVASKINPDDRPRLRPQRQAGARFRPGPSATSASTAASSAPGAKTRTNCATRSRARDAGDVLEAMTKQRSTFTGQPSSLQRIRRSAKADQEASVERAAQFADEILAHAEAVHLADRPGGPTDALHDAQPCSRPSCMCCARPKAWRDTTGTQIDDRQRARRAQRRALRRDHPRAGPRVPPRDRRRRAWRSSTARPAPAKASRIAAIREAYEAAGLSRDRPRPDQCRRRRTCAADGFGHAATIHSELFALNNGRTSWDRKTVVIVDEAAMLDTKLMAMVTAHAHDAGAKLILVGDDRQLSSIDRGGMFGALKDRHGAADAYRSEAAAQDRRAARGRDDGRGQFSRRARHLRATRARSTGRARRARPAPSWSSNGRRTAPRSPTKPALCSPTPMTT